MGNARIAEAAQHTAQSTVQTVQRLRAQMEQVQGRRMDAPVLPVHPALGALLPGGGLRAGGAYCLGRSTSLLFSLLSRPSQDGAWCAVAGLPSFGAEAAQDAGVALSRLVLIPEPGPRWLAVTATIAEVLQIVAVRPPERASHGEISRLAARLRERGAVLLVQGPWPQAEATIDVSEPRWQGLGDGHGLLAERELTVTVTSRRFPSARRARMALPDPSGAVRSRGVPASVRPAARLQAVV